MNLIERVKNYLFFKRFLEGKVEISNFAFKRMVHSLIDTYRDFNKGGRERNIVAKFIKKLRKQYPYEVKGWDEAKRVYFNYFDMPKSIQNIEDLEKGVYLTKYTDDYTYKGEKEFEYHFNEYAIKEFEPFTVKIIDKSINSRGEVSFDYENITDIYHIDSVSDYNLTAYRYSTEEEIENYKEEKARQEKIQQQIDKKQNEIENLRGELWK